MKILGIDTSTASLSLAVTEERLLKSEYTIHHKLTHSEQLMPEIERMLQNLDYTPKDLDAIGVCVGPGSFTGIRIGVASANAMGLALGIPVVGISSLKAMAYSCYGQSKTIFATLDAQRSRVYRAAYHLTEDCREVLSQEVIELDQLRDELMANPGSILLGDGAFMMEDIPEHSRTGRKNRLYIRGSEVCLLAKEALSNNPTPPPAQPVYLRKSQAEIQFDEKMRDSQRYAVSAMNKNNLEGAYAIESLSFTQPWTKTAFAEELKNDKAHYVVIEEEPTGKVVAFGGFWKILEQGHICNIAVHPEYRGLGVGNLIVKALLDKAKALGITELTLEVRPSNEKAKKLYQKFGFKVGGIRKEYYSDNKEDALILWRKEETSWNH